MSKQIKIRIMTKQFTWRSYTIKITKKKIKRANLRIKPEEPDTIHISIPYQISYEAALQILEQPRIFDWIESYQKKADKLSPVKKDWYEDRKQQEPVYRARLQELLPALFTKWETAIGVKSNKVTIRDTRSQWGSCNIRTKNISISVWLGAYPIECIEYVVVHELVHLLEKGHNERFYAYLNYYFPNWKECRDKLKLMNELE